MPIKKISKTKALAKVVDMKAKGEEMHALHNHLIELRRNTAINFLDFGKTFSRIRDEKLYEAMGCETFEEYIATPEISFDRSTVFALVRIFHVFVEEKKITPNQLADIHWSKLHAIAPVITDKNADGLLEMAKTLSRSDLKKEIYNLKSHPDYTGTLFNDEDTILDGIREQCPISRGNICPFFKKYKNDILKEANEKKKNEAK